jgi:regulator of protease activity HflC (stomatin/prohibitin superfamily)
LVHEHGRVITDSSVIGPLLYADLAFAIIMAFLLWRMAYIIRPGEVGVVSIFGVEKRRMKPGFIMVSPLARVVRVPAQPATDEHIPPTPLRFDKRQ